MHLKGTSAPWTQPSDHVANREGGNKKKLICPCTKTYIQFKLIKGKELTLRCLPRLDKHTEKEKKSA